MSQTADLGLEGKLVKIIRNGRQFRNAEPVAKQLDVYDQWINGNSCSNDDIATVLAVAIVHSNGERKQAIAVQLVESAKVVLLGHDKDNPSIQELSADSADLDLKGKLVKIIRNGRQFKNAEPVARQLGVYDQWINGNSCSNDDIATVLAVAIVHSSNAERKQAIAVQLVQSGKVVLLGHDKDNPSIQELSADSADLDLKGKLVKIIRNGRQFRNAEPVARQLGVYDQWINGNSCSNDDIATVLAVAIVHSNGERKQAIAVQLVESAKVVLLGHDKDNPSIQELSADSLKGKLAKGHDKNEPCVEVTTHASSFREPSPVPVTAMQVFDLLGLDSLFKEASSLAWSSDEELSLAEVRPGSSLYDFVFQLWSQSCGSNILRQVQMIDSNDCFDAFNATTKLLQRGRANLGAANPLNPQNFTFPEYRGGLDKLKSAFIKSKSPSLTRVNFLYAFHGTEVSLAKTVIATGPRPLRTTDGGFFGAGSYVALEPSYSCRYSRFHSPDQATGCYTVILYVAVVGAAYVITRRRDYDDITEGPGWSRFFSADGEKAIAILGQYDSHFVPVRYIDATHDYQACDESNAEGHELVLQNWQQLCPIALIHFD